jgi:hypothetical protein
MSESLLSPCSGVCSTAKPAFNILSTQTVAIEVYALFDSFQSWNIEFSFRAASMSVMLDCLSTTLRPLRSNLSFDDRMRGREDNTDRASASLPVDFASFRVVTFLIVVRRQSPDPSV